MADSSRKRRLDKKGERKREDLSVGRRRAIVETMISPTLFGALQKGFPPLSQKREI